MPEIRTLGLILSDDPQWLESDPPPFSLGLSQGVPQCLTQIAWHGIPFTEDEILCLAKLTRLNSMSCTLLQDPSVWRKAAALAHPFPSLTTFELYSPVRTYISLSRVAPLRMVRDLKLAFKDVPDPVDVPRLFASIRSQFNPDVLSSIQLFVNEGDFADRLHEAYEKYCYVLSPHLRPMLGFVHLKKFSVMLPYIYDLDDDILIAMARAWPKINELYIGTDSQHASMYWTPVRATLRALPSFALHCLYLDHLGIQLSAEIPQPFDQLPPELYGELRDQPHGSVSRVKTLYMGCSAIRQQQTSTRTVAKFLSRVFPEAQVKTAAIIPPRSIPNGRIYSSIWEAVGLNVDMLREIRMDERRRWAPEHVQ